MKSKHSSYAFAALCASLLLVAGCGGNSSPNPTPVDSPPSIQFSASPSTIDRGATTTISWKAVNADSVVIDNGIGNVALSGSKTLSPVLNITYTATAVKGTQKATQQLQVTVNGAPLSSVSVSPQTIYLRENVSQQVTAMASFSDGSTEDVTSQVSWSATDATVASMTSSGALNAIHAGTTEISAVLGSVTAQAHVAVNAKAIANVLTYHYDNARDGAITTETTLTPSTVNPAGFGKRYSFPVDGQVYAQPLYVSGLKVQGKIRNVVFVATENDSVYAFDADSSATTPLWSMNFGTPFPISDGSGISPLVGITSTPVIDLATNTLYVLAVNTHSISHFQLHALDLATGKQKPGSPAPITASVAGIGADSDAGSVALQNVCFQRSALVLANGNIYVPFGHCNHGWILAYDAVSLKQTAVFNATPDAAGGTVWMSGGGAAVDAAGELYWMTGTNFGDSQPGYNNAFLKMGPGLTVDDYFMPANNDILIKNDRDLGSGALVLMPDNGSSTPHEVIGGGKDGRIFVIDRDHMGEFQATDDVVQVVDEGSQQHGNLFSTPAYWNHRLYVHSAWDVARAYGWSTTTGRLTYLPKSMSLTIFGGHGATPVVSTNGNVGAIVWEIDASNYSTGGPAVLHAYDATDLSIELYNSAAAGSRDAAGPAIKFTPPVVADGLVFVPTANGIDVYGLL